MNGQDSLRIIRRAHEDAVLDQLRRSGRCSRQDLVEHTGLSRTTLLALVTDLIGQGALIEEPAPTGQPRRGRPLRHVMLNPRGGLWVAIEVGHARVRVAFANAAHQVIGRGEVPLKLGASRATKSRTAIRLLERVQAEQHIATGALRGIALAVVGLAPQQDRDAAALAGQLQERYGAPVLVDNNTRLAAYAEATWGAAKGLRNVLYLRLSDGISSGLIAGGRLLRGAHGLAGEIGHISVDPDGPPCRCGRRGCLEGLLGMTALLAAAGRAGLPIADTEQLLTRAPEEPQLQALIGAAVRRLTDVLRPLTTLLDPDAIVVGGPLARLDDLVVTPIRAAVAADALPGADGGTQVLAAALDTYEAPLGGLALMLHAHPGPGRQHPAGVIYDAVLGR